MQKKEACDLHTISSEGGNIDASEEGVKQGGIHTVLCIISDIKFVTTSMFQLENIIR